MVTEVLLKHPLRPLYLCPATLLISHAILFENDKTPMNSTKMEKSIALGMRAGIPNEFLPKSIFFSISPLANDTDWRNCFSLKASAVYSAITGKDVDVDDRDTMSKASKLLICIAQNCAALIEQSSKTKETNEVTKPKQVADGVAPKNIKGETITLTKPEQAADGAAPKNIEGEIIEVTKPEKVADGAAPESIEDKVKKVIDGVYLVVGFLFDLKSRVRSNWNRENVDAHYISMRRQDIVKDIIKIDNQLPLELLISIAEHVQDVIKRTKDSLVKGNFVNEKDPLLSAVETFRLDITKDNFHEVIRLFCWYYSPFYSKETKPHKDVKKELPRGKDLLQCLQSSLVKVGSADPEARSRRVLRTPTAGQLVKSGLRFDPDDKGLIQIKFSDAVLSIPALVYDFKLETVVWNLLALECFVIQDQKPVTRYFQLLNELIDEISDVGTMKRFGILRGGWKKAEEVMDFVKRVDGFASYPSVYPAVEGDIGKMVDFYDQRMKNFLVRNRPAIVWASSVAALSLLFTAMLAARRTRRRR